MYSLVGLHGNNESLEILASKTETLQSWVPQNQCVLETHKYAWNY